MFIEDYEARPVVLRHEAEALDEDYKIFSVLKAQDSAVEYARLRLPITLERQFTGGPHFHSARLQVRGQRVDLMTSDGQNLDLWILKQKSTLNLKSKGMLGTREWVINGPDDAPYGILTRRSFPKNVTIVDENGGLAAKADARITYRIKSVTIYPPYSGSDRESVYLAIIIAAMLLFG